MKPPCEAVASRSASGQKIYPLRFDLNASRGGAFHFRLGRFPAILGVDAAEGTAVGPISGGKLTGRGFLHRHGPTLIEDSLLGNVRVYLLLRRLSIGLLQMLLARGERGFDRLS